MKKSRILENGLMALTLVLLAAAMYCIFVYVPTERTMGIVQRLFYLMVPVAWLAMLSFVIIFIASILFLRSKDMKWDALAFCAAELGIVFTTATLIVGSMWARPVWGVWWTWEPRLTATLVLWLIYLAYFLVRSFAAEESRGATYAAVIGIVGFVDVPIIAMSTSLWRGVHPGELVFEGGLAPSMALTLIVSIFAFTALYVLLLRLAVLIKQARTEVRALDEARRQ